MPISLNLPEKELRHLVETFGSPLQIYDGSLIVENQKNFIKIYKLKIIIYKLTI